jgi:hypothetical protein
MLSCPDTLVTQAEHDKMVRFHPESVLSGYIVEHHPQGGVADFLLAAAVAADQMMMGLQLPDLVEDVSTARVGGKHKLQLDEQVKRPVDGRAVDGGVNAPNAGVDLTD